MKMVIAAVGPGVTVADIYTTMIPRITAMITEGAICQSVNIVDVVEEGRIYMNRYVLWRLITTNVQCNVFPTTQCHNPKQNVSIEVVA